MSDKRSMLPRRATFCREYVQDRNGTQAAIRAGYSKKSAQQISAELLTFPEIRAEIDRITQALAKATETEEEWIRRRLKEEADNISEFSSHSARVAALREIAKINGLYEKDNAQLQPKSVHVIQLVPLKGKS